MAVLKKAGEKQNRKMRGKILLSNRATDTISPYSNREIALTLRRKNGMNMNTAKFSITPALLK